MNVAFRKLDLNPIYIVFTKEPSSNYYVSIWELLGHPLLRWGGGVYYLAKYAYVIPERSLTVHDVFSFRTNSSKDFTENFASFR